MESKKIVKYIIANVKVPIAIFDDQSYEYLKSNCITNFEEMDMLPDFPSQKINLQEKIKQIFTSVENLETPVIKTDETLHQKETTKEPLPIEEKEKLPQKVLKEEIQNYKKQSKQNQTFKNHRYLQKGSHQLQKNHRYSIKQKPNVESVASDLVQQLMEKEE
jgi:hypothetical protein